MTQADQTASPDAREASKSRVTTRETLLAPFTAPEQTAQAASAPASEAKTPEVKEGEHGKEGEAKAKKPANERIQELIARSREAEEKASEAERRAQELEARVQALQAQAKPLEVDDRPVRSKFATDDEYIDAMADWRAKQVIAQREQEQARAKAEAEQAEIAAAWSKRQEAVMKVLPDYADVLSKSDVQLPDYLWQAIVESDVGPQVAYYLALKPEEAQRLARLKPINAVKRFAAIERDLADIEAEEVRETPAAAAQPQTKVQKSKAPEPIEPVRSVPSAAGHASESYQDYKARRQAERRAAATR